METKTKLFAYLIFALTATLRIEAQAQPQFFTIHHFHGSAGDGALPVGNMVADPNGNIFGVTQNGGMNNSNNGTFFALLPAGGNSYIYTNLYNFTGLTNAGGHPIGDLSIQVNGQANLAANQGKVTDNPKPADNPQPTETVSGTTRVATFASFFIGFFNAAGIIKPEPDEIYYRPLPPPQTGSTGNVVQVEGQIKPLVVVSGNTLYGVNIDSIGDGGVYFINTNGTGYTVLHVFSNSPDGFFPNYSLTLSGNTLYGTTRYGGSKAGGNNRGNGTVWKVNTDGSGYAVLHYFTNNPDGATPMDGVVISGGTLYGTTSAGGDYNGTVFSITTNGNGFKVIGVFEDDIDCGEPNGDLLLSGSTLYGTAEYGGAKYGGSVYSINTNGSNFTELYGFSYPALNGASGTSTNSDGCNPTGGLLLSGNLLVGATPTGGTYGDGTVFEIILPSPPAPPSLNIAPAGGNYAVSWPSAATNFVLQQNSNLATTNWSTNSFAISDDGTNKSVSILPTAGSVFFRLINTNVP